VPVINLNIDYDSVFLPVYKPLQTTEAKLKFIYGGRDSGKSRDIAQRKIIDCLSKSFFRCILIKKTFNSIKDSQWQLIKDICEEWNIESLFEFKTSPLEIKCKVNGNKFICRGMDDPAKIKSISEPSDAWIEEGNQLSLEDWIYIITTLRSNRGPVGIEMSFNTETKGDFVDFWLYKEYFAHTTEKSFTHTKTIAFGSQSIDIKYIAIHSTYRDNPYVTLERKAYHEGLQTLNYYWYRVFTLGEWGNEENESPWLFAFDRHKHVSSVELFAKRSEILYLSWDFNRNPTVATVIQWYGDVVYIIEVFKIPNVGTEGICEMVRQKYKGYVIVVTGDYSGDTVSSIFKEQVTNYTVIKKELSLNDGQIKITPNPPLKSNRTLVNGIHAGYKVLYCPVKAKPAIYDAENVRMIADGTIEKKNRKDPAQQADVLDTTRYWFNMFMGWFIKK
jgi:phage terminase large subunit